MFHRNKLHFIGALAIMLLAAILVACAPNSAAQGATQTLAPGGGITVVGSGEAIGAPDQAEVQVGVETFAPEVAAATSENEATIANILETLAELGIAAEDIQTTNYSVWPEQRYGENGPEDITGYRVSNQVNVTIRDIDRVGEILAAVTDAGANSIFGVRFSVAEPDALEAEAREAAIADARARAASLAGLSEVELGQVIAISEVIGQPQPFYGMGGGAVMEEAASAPSVSPGQQTVRVQVQVTFAID